MIPHRETSPSDAVAGPPEPYIPPEGPPQGIRLNPRIYERMGDAGITLMIHDFYVELGQSPIAHLFGRSLETSVDRSAAFFIGLLGGPPRYAQRFGPPAMRARHLPFAIDQAARREWLNCFGRVLVDAPTRYGFPTEDLPEFRRFLEGFSGWMVNRPG